MLRSFWRRIPPSFRWRIAADVVECVALAVIVAWIVSLYAGDAACRL